MPKIVGIDLGTTNSVVAVVEGHEATVITFSDGGRLCPSVVGFNKSGERLVGQLAKRQALAHPDRTIRSIKRKMGTDYRVKIDNREYGPPEVSAMILQKVKADAEAYLGEKIEKAVVTVPAYFSDAQRQATKDAGAIAGLEVVRILNEPTAAALAYGIAREDVQNVLVWDLGGGTFDVSVMEMGDGLFEVKATCGDTSLGGDDWDARLMEWLADEFERRERISLRRDRMAMQRVLDAAEKAKIELSSRAQTGVNLPFLSSGPDGPVHLDLEVSRSQFERITSDLLDRLLAPTRQALNDAQLRESDLDCVLLVGGSTRMAAVQELVRKLFGKEPYQGINPDEAVAIGAALQGGVLNDEVPNTVLLDVTPLSLGIETLGGVMTRLIERNTKIPTQGKKVFTTASDGQTQVNIKVYQGESEISKYNKFLADFTLTGLPRAPRGVPQVEVVFDIDVNGIVHVAASDLRSGRRHQIQVSNATGLSPEEIERLSRAVQNGQDGGS
jgi:molecular chaperone DnaK